MIKLLRFSLGLYIFSNVSVALADCETGSKTVFSCVTGKGKVIEVCDSVKTIDYSFGKPKSKPEIVVRVPRNEASTTQWQGIGRYESYSVEIPNGKTLYSVFWSADKLSETHAVEAGVNVEVNQNLVATVKCAGEKHITQHIEGLNLKATE